MAGTALSLLAALLGATGLAYTVLAFAWPRLRAGALGTYIATSPEREEEAREAMLAELARFANEPVTPDELRGAVGYLAGQAEVQRQSAGHVLSEIVEAWLIGRGLEELEDPARLVAGGPERVPLAPRLEDEIAGAGLDDVVAQQGAHASLEHVAVLVLAAVLVHRRRVRPRRHRMLDE